VRGGASIRLLLLLLLLLSCCCCRCRYAEVNVQRQLNSRRVKLPESWEADFAKLPKTEPKQGGEVRTRRGGSTVNCIYLERCIAPVWSDELVPCAHCVIQQMKLARQSTRQPDC
jgi:hypothetical protein